MRLRRSIALAAVCATAIPFVGASPATAKAAAVRSSGSCSASADWKLKAKPDNGRIEVEGEVDSNRAGQTWKWRLRHNSHLVAKGSAKTKAPSGSFSIQRRTANLAGADTLAFRAVNPKSGEVCRGTVKL